MLWYHISRSRRVTTRLSVDDSGDEVLAGVCEDICITRDKVPSLLLCICMYSCLLMVQTTGNIILDIEMSESEIEAIKRAIEANTGKTCTDDVDNYHC